ncbi:gp436 family protein [Profundibacterium mesophilum]|uniref:DUF1320 domain-containing protein n=1 Tax=Profundibacterium mesophilum KAUST100406-0324 TaxID=1037889 RepID=A0A921TDW2_9RHOB|nr:DUF1320 domain-containing protein [Profundibacterium mesophilum]KAF0676741.1 hypothetical protein PMES_00928 [Profundibacterium mesophilum KAUST100406-0324]
MIYAAQSDIEALYGPDALYAADRDGDGIADAPAIAQALASASAEIDGHLAVRYDLPVPGTHPILVQYCVDIALYRLANAGDVMTTEHRTRFEDAISALKRIARGEMRLTLPASDDPDAPAGPRPIVSSGPPRLFSRTALRDF